MNFFRYYCRKIWKWLNKTVFILPSRIAILLGVFTLLLLPVISHDPYLLRIMTMTAIFAILTASWDLLSGFTGQMNFGHALFFGVGAYVAGLLSKHFQLVPWLTVPVGAVGAVGAGLLIGIPCLRLRGTYLALTTLTFPIILMGIVFYFSDYTGGELGIFGIQPLFRGGGIEWLGLSGPQYSKIVTYYIVIVTMLVCCFVMWKITDSKIGILFHAIREDEVAARAMGINTIRYKLLAFSISGFFGGVAGGLYAHFLRLAGPSTLEILMSFQIVIWGIFGGIATIYGPVFGVFLLFPLLEYLQVFPQLRTLIFAAIVLLTLIYMPEGIIPRIRDKIEVICPRCKLRNFVLRKECRVCNTALE